MIFIMRHFVIIFSKCVSNMYSIEIKKRKFYDFIFNLSVLLCIAIDKSSFFTNKNCFGPNKFCYLGGKYREFIATCSV